MTPAALLAALAQALHEPLASRQCVLDVASDIEHQLELLANSPTGMRAILLWSGATEVATEGGGAMTGRFDVTIQANPGLAVDAGKWLYHPSNERESLLSFCGWMVALVRSLKFTVPNPPALAEGQLAGHPQIDPRGARLVDQQWLLLEGLPTVQLQHNFELGFTLEALPEFVPVPVAALDSYPATT